MKQLSPLLQIALCETFSIALTNQFKLISHQWRDICWNISNQAISLAKISFWKVLWWYLAPLPECECKELLEHKRALTNVQRLQIRLKQSCNVARSAARHASLVKIYLCNVTGPFQYQFCNRKIHDSFTAWASVFCGICFKRVYRMEASYKYN